jgi:hypothetical protein
MLTVNIANPALGVKKITMDFKTPLSDELPSRYRYPTPPPAMKLHRYTDIPTIEINRIPKDMNMADYILTLFPAVEHIKIRLIRVNGMSSCIIPRVVCLFERLIERCEFTFVLVHVEMSRNPNVKEEDRRYLKEVYSAFLYTAWSVGLERKLRLTSYVGY